MRRHRRSQTTFDVATAASALVPALAVAIAIGAALAMAWPSVRDRPLGFFVVAAWDPGAAHFGALPFLVGSAVTSAVALVLALPVAIGAALFLAEVAPARAQGALDVAVDVAAAVPSVVWGLFALDVVLPLVDGGARALSTTRPADLAPGGFSLLSGGIVLAFMVAPTTTAVAREVLRAVPRAYREAAIALGATPWEVVRLAVWPSARGGLLGAALLGLGRALGEATAMSMVLGARTEVPGGLLAPGHSAAALLLHQLGEASDARHVAALGHVALALLAISMTVHALARVLVDRGLGRAGTEGA